MTQDISGFGTRIVIQASNTFPSGFSVTQSADDADPIDIPSIQLADKAMTLNGTLVKWSKANPIPVTLNVIPGSNDDRNLQVLASANRAAAGRRPARDVITMTVVYPSGETTRLMRGVITDAPPAKSIASAGRMKTNAYVFAFEDFQ